MADTFQRQLEIVSEAFQDFFSGRHQLAICVGSGISLDKMPMLHKLIARAFRNIELTDASEGIFAIYSGQTFMSYQLQDRGIPAPNPVSLSDFRTLAPTEQENLCKNLVGDFGEIFGRLQNICNRSRLLELIEFTEFQGGNPDACHYYIAYLIQERKLRRIITTNWDLLIEEALRRTCPQQITDILNVIYDDPTYVTRNELADQVYAKVHGSAQQYPADPDSIVLTNEDIEAATTPGNWKQQLLYDYLDGTVLFCGYSAGDSSIRIPAKALELRDANNALAGCSYYFAELHGLSEVAVRFTQGDNRKHIRLYANDVFCSMYFGWLVNRLKSATEAERGQGQYHFPRWQPEDWSAVIDRLQQKIEQLTPEFLESTIGAPAGRRWDERSGLLPVMLSTLAQLASRGQVENGASYGSLPLETHRKTTEFLLMLMALKDVAQELASILTAQFESSYCGLTMLDENGASRNIILLYGPAPQGAVTAVDLYLNKLERENPPLPSPEVIIVPCEQYVYLEDTLELPDFARRGLRGEFKVNRRYISPNKVFLTQSYNELVQFLKSELEKL
jgi:hypothetical protein